VKLRAAPALRLIVRRKSPEATEAARLGLRRAAIGTAHDAVHAA